MLLFPWQTVSSLIWVCTVCICHFNRNFEVQSLRRFTVLIRSTSFFIPCHTIVAGYYGLHWTSVYLSIHRSVRRHVRPSIFRFRMITSKHQWIFTKLGVCIDIVDIWFGIANGQMSNFYGVFCPRHARIFVS